MIIVSEVRGQLGNRLFLSAYGLALAQATNQRYLNLSLHEYACHFPEATLRRGFIRLPNLGRRLFRLLIKIVRKLAPNHPMFTKVDFFNTAPHSPSNPRFLDEVRSRSITFVEGWPDPAEVTFQPTQPIRDIFKPSPQVLQSTQAHAARARGDADVLMGVHIRLGDFKNQLGGLFYYPVETFRQVMVETVALFGSRRVAFLVCSNESLSIDLFAPLSVTMGPGTLMGDLHSLAACDYIMGPPSTYSTWAAFSALKPIYVMMTAAAPTSLADFTIPDGNFECLKVPWSEYRDKGFAIV